MFAMLQAGFPRLEVNRPAFDLDENFIGTVDDFDGALQQANLEAGPHRIELRDEAFETIGFDVNVEPGRTITYRASMRPLQP